MMLVKKLLHNRQICLEQILKNFSLQGRISFDRHKKIQGCEVKKILELIIIKIKDSCYMLQSIKQTLRFDSDVLKNMTIKRTLLINQKRKLCFILNNSSLPKPKLLNQTLKYRNYINYEIKWSVQ